MRDIPDFLRWVMPYASSCPEPVAEAQILAAARDFCAATRCWRFVDTIAVRDDTPEILCVPPQATLFEIEEAAFDGRKLERVSYIDTSEAAGDPYQISQADMNSVRINPHAAGSLKLSIFLQPAQHADALPDILYDRWAEQIADGALARILELPGLAFTDLNNAAYRRARFEDAKSSNFNISKRGQQRAPSRTRARFF